MRSEGDDTLALFTDGITTWPAPTPDNERPTETYYLPDKRKASAQLQPGEVAYVICHDPKCQQLNEIGCTPG